MEARRERAFAPEVGAGTRVLVLGSLPGAESLRQGQYYAHPRNQFWALAGGVIGVELVGRDYPARLAALAAAGIGLWDVIASAVRPGSLDAAIREAEAADLVALVARLPALRGVAFNGATAARIGRRQLAGTGVPMLDLPSSSPAHAGMRLEAKLACWREMGGWLN